jgi:hypothetical protein
MAYFEQIVVSIFDLEIRYDGGAPQSNHQMKTNQSLDQMTTSAVNRVFQGGRSWRAFRHQTASPLVAE